MKRGENMKFTKIIPALLVLLCICSCFEEKLEFNGNQIHYEVRGESDKTLVFIHGWTSCTEVWKFQLNEFPDYKVIAVDLPGNGKSGKNEEASYSSEELADSVIAVLEKENIKKAVFAGHSMGFAVTEIIAVKYPEYCVGICSIDGAHFEVPKDQLEREMWIEYNREFAESMNAEEGREFFINMLFLPDTPKLLKEEIMNASRKVPLPVAKALINGVEESMEYWEEKTVNIPCLAVYSPAYQMPPDYEDTFKSTFPDLEYHYINNVSHFYMLEVPYKLNQLIYDFLKKVYK
jgi:pimeloyl-ACP methyl ester carboxylesterase